MIANYTPKVPEQFWGKMFFDHLQLFWSPLFAAANAAAATRLSDGNEHVFRNFAPEKSLVFCYVFLVFLSLAAAAAAATTRSSDGNEKVFRNFTTEK